MRNYRPWSRWIRAEQFIEKHGECYPLKDGNGKTKCLAAFPQVATANKLGMLLTRMEAEFGMTPSARSRIQVPAGAGYVEDEEDRRMFGDDGNSVRDFLRRSKESS